jgi:hypothetical protein
MGLVCCAAIAIPWPCHAQSPASTRRALDLDPVEQAFVTTLRTGRPTFILVTSKSSPTAHQLWEQMLGSPRARQLMDAAQFVEVVAEEEPARVRQLGVGTAPVVCVIRKNKEIIEKEAQRAMPRGTASLIDWVESTVQDLAPVPQPVVDAELQRSHFQVHAAAQASPQVPQYSPPPPPQQAPPQQSPPYSPPLQGVPVVNAPSPPPVAVTMSSPPVYVQQSAPTVVLGPTPPPNIVIAQAVPSMPTVSMAVPAQSPPQMMLSAPPQQQPMMALPQPQSQPQPQPMMAAPQPQPMMAVPQPAPAAAVPQQSIVGTAALGLILSNPNLIDRLLGAIGRLLAQRGLPRLQLNQAAPASFSPTMVPVSQAGFVTQLQLQSGIPAVPQQLYNVPPQEQPCPPKQPPQASCPTPCPNQPSPSPQAGNPGPYASPQAQSRSFFSRLFHHD